MATIHDGYMWKVSFRGVHMGRINAYRTPVIVGALDPKAAIDIATDWWGERAGRVEAVEQIADICLFQELEEENAP